VAASEAPVIISAAITAVAVLSAQGITQFFGGRRDTSRLQWERDRQEREWEIRRGERFLDLKRELYSDYLIEAGELMIYINWEPEVPDAPPPEEPPDTAGLRRIQERISLVAPTRLFTKVQAASATVTGAMWAVAAGAGPEDIREEKAEAMGALDAMLRDMRADLRGEKDRFFGLENVPPDPPPAHTRFWRRRSSRVRPLRR
jgi:hypothetical protein